MHPFLTHPRRLFGYLAVWAVLAAVPISLLALPEGSWQGAVVLGLPATVGLGLFTLPTWYVCRALPPRAAALPRLISTHAIVAMLWAVLWVALLEGVAALIAFAFGFEELAVRLESRRGSLLAVGGLFYLLAVAFHYLLASLMEAREAEQRQAALALAAREAQLNALKAQVHPHFLFNSLNAVSALTTQDAGRARQMCLLLADFLRKSLATGEASELPLSEELALSEAYLGVETIRLGSRLQVEMQVDETCRDCLMPPLLLQPLVENAVRHGIATLAQGGTLTLAAGCQGGELRVRVANPFDPAAPARPRSGRGLANVRNRLQARYGKEARLQVQRGVDTFSVSLCLPCERQVTR